MADAFTKDTAEPDPTKYPRKLKADGSGFHRPVYRVSGGVPPTGKAAEFPGKITQAQMAKAINGTSEQLDKREWANGELTAGRGYTKAAAPAAGQQAPPGGQQAPPAPTPDPADEPADDPVDYDAMLKADLVQLAGDRGLDTSGNKANLIKRLEDDDG